MQTNYFKIGLFTFSGIFLLIGGLLLFGLSDSLFKDTVKCVTFFNRSVQGLSADSTVKFRGFRVGRITAISLASVTASHDQPVVKVEFEIEPALLAGNDDENAQARKYLVQQVDRGLKVILSFQGLTGLGFLDLDYDQSPKSNYFDRLRQWSAQHDQTYIPGGTAQIMQIGEAVSEIVKSLSKVDFDTISHEITELLSTLDTTVQGLDTAQISDNLHSTLVGVRNTSEELKGFLTSLKSAVQGNASSSIMKEAETTLEQMRRTLKHLSQALNSSQGNLPMTLDNLRVMSENLRELSELLKNQPSQAVFGGPPPHVNP